mmetsp:Transcript_51375/g.76231  ORF Transcript_51375/g.76231 Transcript_51375/m.76231 type:complete len:203 (+) Transcript_51375:497-1105(+)
MPRGDLQSAVVEGSHFDLAVFSRCLHNAAYDRRTTSCNGHYVATAKFADSLLGTVGHRSQAAGRDAASTAVVVVAHVHWRNSASLGSALDLCAAAGSGRGELKESVISLIANCFEKRATIMLNARVLEVVAALATVRKGERRRVVAAPTVAVRIVGEGQRALARQVSEQILRQLGCCSRVVAGDTLHQGQPRLHKADGHLNG